MDLEQDNDFLIYLVSFLGSLSVLPGNIISALLMDRVGRLKMIGELLGTPHSYSRGLRQWLKVYEDSGLKCMKAVEFFLKKSHTGNHTGKMESAGVEPRRHICKTPGPRGGLVHARDTSSFPDSAIL